MSFLGFEFMGNPSGYFLDFEDKEQVVRWRNLITLLASRYIGKFQKKKKEEKSSLIYSVVIPPNYLKKFYVLWSISRPWISAQNRKKTMPEQTMG